ncbi:elongation factor P [Patescibacteria group bacterium]
MANTITTSDFKKGVALIWKNEPYVIIDFQKVNPGKGSAFTRTKIKNCQTGKVIDITFKASEQVEQADLTRKKAQYLYEEPNSYNFMEQDNYEQVSIDKETLGEDGKYLKEDLEVYILYYNNNPISIDLPAKISYKVIEAPQAVKGDTSSTATKFITLENGLSISAPIFIKENDLVRVNTDTGEYIERCSTP